MIMAIGDHIRVDRGLYWHHGIDAGEGRVIHQTGEPGRALDAAIRETSMDPFLRDGSVELVGDTPAFSPAQVVSRARSRIGETGYDLLLNNCEHFTCWCMTGEAESKQVERVAWQSMALGTAARLGSSILLRSSGTPAAFGILRFLGPAGTAAALGGAVIMAVSRLRRA